MKQTMVFQGPWWDLWNSVSEMNCTSWWFFPWFSHDFVGVSTIPNWWCRISSNIFPDLLAPQESRLYKSHSMEIGGSTTMILWYRKPPKRYIMVYIYIILYPWENMIYTIPETRWTIFGLRNLTKCIQSQRRCESIRPFRSTTTKVALSHALPALPAHSIPVQLWEFFQTWWNCIQIKLIKFCVSERCRFLLHEIVDVNLHECWLCPLCLMVNLQLDAGVAWKPSTRKYSKCFVSLL